MNKHITFRTLGSLFQRKQEKGELRVPSKIPACRKKPCLNFFNFPIRSLFFWGGGRGGVGEERGRVCVCVGGGRWVLGEGRKNTVNAPVTFALLILDKTALLMSDC